MANTNEYRVAQYGKLFFIEIKVGDQQFPWRRTDIFGLPLNGAKGTNHPLPPYNSLQEAFDAIKELPGELPKPVHFYLETDN